jgi:hypothetical protein
METRPAASGIRKSAPFLLAYEIVYDRDQRIQLVVRLLLRLRKAPLHAAHLIDTGRQLLHLLIGAGGKRRQPCENTLDTLLNGYDPFDDGSHFDETRWRERPGIFEDFRPLPMVHCCHSSLPDNQGSQ